MRMLFRFSSLLLASPLAFAQSTGPAPELGSSLLQLFTGLGAVLLLLVGSLWLIKKVLFRRDLDTGLLRVVTGTAIGARERVVIVEVGTTWLVLGVAPGRVTALAEIPRQAMPQVDSGVQGGFPEWLKNLSQKK